MAVSGAFGKRWTATALAIVVTLAALVLEFKPAFLIDAIPPLSLLDRLEGENFDLRFRVRGVEKPGPETVIVAADERTAAVLGRWPFSQRSFATAIDRLKADGAKVIAFDVIFPQAELAFADDVRQRLGRIQQSLPQDAEPAKALQAVLDAPSPAEAMAQSMRAAGNVLIGFTLVDEVAKGSRLDPAADYIEDWAAFGQIHARPDKTTNVGPREVGVLPPVDALGKAAFAAGFVNLQKDVDSAPRFENMARQFDQETYPPLSLATAAAYLGLTPLDLELTLATPPQTGSVKVGEHTIPIDDDGRTLVNYYGPSETFPTYSLIDVLQGNVQPGTFKDKIVYIGATLTAVQDIFKSPFALYLPGVERHATITQRILDGQSLVEPGYAELINRLVLVVLALLTAVLTARLPASGAMLATVVLVVAWWGAGQLALFPGGIRLDFVHPAIAILLNFVAMTVLRVVREEQQRRAAERSLRVSEERYALAARGANDGLWDWDLATSRFYTSPRWHSMLGIAAEETRQTPDDWYNRTHAEDVTTLRAAIDAHLHGQSAHFEQEFRMRHADQSDRWMQARGLAVVDKVGKPYRFAGSMTDITDRKLAERQLLFDAFHSRLTGLPNRALLIDRINQQVQLWQRGTESDVIVLILDLDHFRHINETLGQAIGDQVLISLARKLDPALRHDDTLAHLGEDEFAILRFAAGDVRGQLEQLLGTLYSVMAEPISIDGRDFEMTASIGYVFASQSAGDSGDELLRDANLALYKAKTTGRNKAEPFEAAMHATAVKRFDLEADLRRAIAKGGELELFYQPIIDIQNDRMHGYEALLRWRHPTRGLVSPIDFIPLAEDTGLIVEIGRRCILEAARQIQAWTPPGGGKPPQVAVNVSGRQFAADGLLDDIENALRITEIPPGSLKVEVTESLVMDNPERTVDLLKRIMAIGCKVSIDDFGTGYSSLSHLHRFPFNTLKIDRSFIVRMADSREGFEIVRVIASMAKVLDRDVVAEGVEDQTAVNTLRELGVEFVQGYVYSKPLPAAEATAFLEKWREKERARGANKAAS
jgi:diguanylate cyclase (GGDEF)-like protein/PAS domain S-box-containing protein